MRSSGAPRTASSTWTDPDRAGNTDRPAAVAGSPASAAPAEGQIRGAGGATAVEGSSVSDGAANVDTTDAVNLSSEAANGTWRLRVRDLFPAGTGFVNSWTLTL